MKAAFEFSSSIGSMGQLFIVGGYLSQEVYPPSFAHPKKSKQIYKIDMEGYDIGKIGMTINYPLSKPSVIKIPTEFVKCRPSKTFTP